MLPRSDHLVALDRERERVVALTKTLSWCRVDASVDLSAWRGFDRDKNREILTEVSETERKRDGLC